MNIKSFNQFISEQSSAKPNMGDVFEFVFAAACVSRFADRYDDGSEMTVTAKSIHSVMDEYFKGNQTWQIPEGDNEIDQVTLTTAAIPLPSMNYLRDAKNRKSKEVSSMIGDAIKAVENRRYRISKLAFEVIGNNKADDVDVQPAGTSDQKGTKSDVNIIVNGTLEQGISLKYKSRQMGQFSGGDIVKQLTDAWSSLGVDVSRSISPVKKAVPNLIGLYTDRKDSNYNPRDRDILFDAVKQMTRSMPKSIDVSSLVNGVTKAMKGTEEDLEVVSGSFTIGREFRSQFEKKLKGAQSNKSLAWVIKTSGKSPVVQLVADGRNIIDVRTRIDMGSSNKEGMKKLRVRTLIELGPDFKRYIEE